MVQAKSGKNSDSDKDRQVACEKLFPSKLLNPAWRDYRTDRADFQSYTRKHRGEW